MGTIYLESCRKTDSSVAKYVSVESLVILHAIRCLQNNNSNIDIVFVDSQFDFHEPCLPLEIDFVPHTIIGRKPKFLKIFTFYSKFGT